MKRILATLFVFVALTAGSCEKPVPDPEPEPEPVPVAFAKGADVSWGTQMEKEGCRFYDASGTQTECMSLLKSLGMNAIRLRVWVNPTGGWCGKDDVVANRMDCYNIYRHHPMGQICRILQELLLQHFASPNILHKWFRLHVTEQFPLQLILQVTSL